METRRLNILFLTDNFPPERNVPAMRTWEHVSRWVKDGHQVTVITTAPNFPQGKPLAGYKNHWYFKEDMGGVRSSASRATSRPTRASSSASWTMSPSW